MLTLFVVPSASGDLSSDGPTAATGAGSAPDTLTPPDGASQARGTDGGAAILELAEAMQPDPLTAGAAAPSPPAVQASPAAVAEGEAGAPATGEEEGEEGASQDENGTPAADGPAASALAQPDALAAAGTAPIIGTNDAVGWGSAAAATIHQGHITWNRVELSSKTNTLSGSINDGFKVLLVAGNTSDSTPLSQVAVAEWGARVTAELKANAASVTLAEAGNEMYLKGGVANPVQYAHLYMAAIEDLKAAGVHVPLLFNMTGDFPHGTWGSPTGWSQDSSGGGWLREAVKAVPALAKAILANGVAIHPYGEVGENHHDDYGVSAIAAEESVARTVLGSIPSFYVTEFGYSLSACGRDLGACSAKEQAAKMKSAYSVMLADPNIAGIWWYQSHDDSTGRFGFMTNANKPRPSFKTLSAIAVGAGQ